MGRVCCCGGCLKAAFPGTLCRCVYQRPDEAGNIGVELNKDLVKVAAKAMTTNMTRLGESWGWNCG